MAGVSRSPLDRVRGITLALPEVNERRSHSEPCFFVRDERPLCYFHDDHNGGGRISLWCPAPPGVQDELVSTDAVRFFRPAPSAGGIVADWVGVFLDRPPPSAADWREIAEVVGCVPLRRTAQPREVARPLNRSTGGLRRTRVVPVRSDGWVRTKRRATKSCGRGRAGGGQG